MLNSLLNLNVNNTKHRVFISYHHQNDQEYKNYFENYFGDIFINHSVAPGDINTDVSHEYVKKLIQNGYVQHSSVVVVLLGTETHLRKHVDWEISAALSSKVGGCSGLVGILLPTHLNFNKGPYSPDLIPPRLKDNTDSGYAKIYNWTEDKKAIQNIIEEAFESKISLANKIDNSRIQFSKNKSGEA